MIARTAVFFSIKKTDAKTAPVFLSVDYLVRVEVSVGIGYAFFSKSVDVSFAVHPVSVLIHGTDDVVALRIVEIRFASYLNGAVSVCGRIVIVLISVGIFDTVLVEGVRGSVGILPASVRHLGDIHTVSAAVIEITGSFGGSRSSGVGRIASGGITGAAVVRISGGSAAIASVSDSVVFSVAFSVVFLVAFSVSDSDSVETRVVVSDWPTWIFSLCLRQPLKLKVAAIITARTSAPHFFLFRIVSYLPVNRFRVTTAIIEDLGENCNFVTGKKS